VATVLEARSLRAVLEARHTLDVVAAMRRAEARGHALVPYGSAHYPALLLDAPGAPFLLYAAGCIERLQRTTVAIVGTRRATEYGRMAARRIAGDVSAAGLAVASGLAIGIDAAAHGAAADGPGGTIAVLGCGLDIDYPHANRALRRRIERRGAVVTEHPPGTQPSRGHFPARNRIVSGMAAATVVVEAGAKSGALITARHALEQNRDVFAVPGSIFSNRCAGSNALLAAGAGPALCADDVLTALGIAHLSPRSDAATPIQPDDEAQRALLGLLRSETMHVDALCRAAGLGAAETARALTIMEMKGWVRHMGNMNWMAIR
jgi:DNA processing protein